MQFYETKMGRTFFEHQIPQLIAAIEKVAAAVSNSAPPAILSAEADPKFLHNLFFGDYEPEVYRATPEIQQLNRTVSSAHHALKEVLSEEGQKRLDVYEKKLSERNAAVTELSYESGVRAAVQMIMAGLSHQAAPQADKANEAHMDREEVR